MEERNTIHNVPVPERFLPLVHKVLAQAYAGEAIEETGREAAAQADPAKRSEVKESVMDEWTGVWTKYQIVSAYRGASPRLRAVLEHLAKHSEDKVTALELAQAVYPNDSGDKAEKRLYGVLRHLTTPTDEYGHRHWFVKAEGSPSGFTYKMFDREAEWIKEAGERE
ncbi:MAG: hypothetical protein ACR2GU_12780 [Rubrobacteraceae bacterium]